MGTIYKKVTSYSTTKFSRLCAVNKKLEIKVNPYELVYNLYKLVYTISQKLFEGPEWEILTRNQRDGATI